MTTDAVPQPRQRCLLASRSRHHAGLEGAPRLGSHRPRTAPPPSPLRFAERFLTGPTAFRTTEPGTPAIISGAGDADGRDLNLLVRELLDVHVFERDDAHARHEARRSVHVPHPGVGELYLE